MLKELREIAGLAALGLAAQLLAVAALIGMRPFADWLPLAELGLPFQERQLAPSFVLVGVAFLVVLGFWQTGWESGRGTYLFLLHLPMRRRTAFLTKIAVGIGTYLVCTLVPLLLYAWWAAIPGHYPGPFEWSMTSYAWRLCAVMPLLYLGAFLGGLHPGRWYGTRLLPLVATGLFVAWLLNFEWWSRLGLPVTATLYGLLLAAICSVARQRDFS